MILIPRFYSRIGKGSKGLTKQDYIILYWFQYLIQELEKGAREQRSRTKLYIINSRNLTKNWKGINRATEKDLNYTLSIPGSYPKIEKGSNRACQIQQNLIGINIKV